MEHPRRTTVKRLLAGAMLSLSVITGSQEPTAQVDANTYAYSHWRDWRIFHIGDRIDGYTYVMFYKASDGCHLQTVDTSYKADTLKCGDNVDGWGKIEMLKGSQVVTVIPTTKKGKGDSYQVNIFDPQPKRFHDT
jgi:hypothetical protein